MSNLHKKGLQHSIRRRRRVGHSFPERTPRRSVVKREGERAEGDKKRDKIKCQIFIEQRDGGTVWVPCKTIIVDKIGSQVVIRNQDEFPTLGSAAEAAQHKALSIIKKKYSRVCTDDIDWSLVSEDIGGFVMA